MSLKVRAILVVVIGTVMGLSLSIGGGLLANGPAPAEADSPAALLREGVDKLLVFMRSEQASSPDELAAFLDTEVAPFFDFDYMAKVAAGGMYRMMSEQQRSEMADKLKITFLGTLADRLGGFDGQEVKFLAARVNPDGRTGSASMAVVNPGSYPARIDFRFYRSGETWKIYDVLANGQSAVAYYRREFRQMMRAGQGMPGPGDYGMPGRPMMGGYR